MDSYPKGSIVRLKSGGPKMVVDSIGLASQMNCAWFAKLKLRAASFSMESLKLVKLPKGSGKKTKVRQPYQRPS